MNTPKMSTASQCNGDELGQTSGVSQTGLRAGQQPGVLTLAVNERDADQVCCFSKLSSGQRTAGRRKRIMNGGSDPGGRGSNWAASGRQSGPGRNADAGREGSEAGQTPLLHHA